MTRIDPVCSVKVDDVTAPGYVEYRGRDYFFCSLECKQKFEHNPAEYVEEAAA